MKPCAYVFILFVGVMPAFGQGPDETAERDLSPGGQFALGNLALRQLTPPNDPVQDLKEFFDGVKLPLSREQRRSLETIVQSHTESLQSIATSSPEGGRADALRKLNQEYVRLVNAALTSEQQGAWRHYRVEQLKLRGGFPAIKAILESAGVPLTEDKEKSIEKIFENFATRQARLVETNSNPGVADVDRLVIAEFNRVVALLTPEQRRALISARRRTEAPGSTNTSLTR